MVSKRKQQRRELQEPDQFVSFWTRTGEVLARRAKVLLAVTITILVSVAGVQIARTLSTRKGAERAQAIARVARIAEAPLLPAEGEAPRYDDGVPHFKTDAERKQAAIQEADEVIRKHGGAALTRAMEAMKARYLMDLGRYADALALYRALDEAGGLSEELRLIVGEGLAYALEAKGDVTQAIDAFARLAERAQKAGGFYRDRALFNQARLLQKQGERDKAREILRTLSDEFPQSSLRDEVTERLALLDEAAAPAQP